MRKLIGLPLVVGAALLVSSMAFADSIGPITFESPDYSVGSISGQNGWMKTGNYDVAVAQVSDFANAAGFGFGSQALRVSNAFTQGSFGDQTFSPGLATPAGEATSANHFEASFDIGSASAAPQTDMSLSVSPDDGQGSRMSYVRFEDQSDGIHVFFDDATDAGPLGTQATFNETDVATLDRTQAHSIRFSIDFVPGPANDVVKLYVDGSLAATGTTWEDYYRYDAEQAGNGNVVPAVSKLLFREAGTAVPANAGMGYLVDNVSLSSTSIVTPASKADCKDAGWQSFNNPAFENQGDCISYVASGSRH